MKTEFDSESGGAPIPPPDQGLSREVKVVAGVVVLGVVMSVLDTTIVNVALTLSHASCIRR